MKASGKPTAASQTRRYYPCRPWTAAFGRCRAVASRTARKLWYSRCDLIGYSLPAAFGAQNRLPRSWRVILIIGDGAAQLTMIQEMGSMLRETGRRQSSCCSTMTAKSVERAIHGAAQRVQRHRELELDADTTGAKRGATGGVLATQGIQLAEVLERLARPQRLSFIEVMLPKPICRNYWRTVTRALKPATGIMAPAAPDCGVRDGWRFSNGFPAKAIAVREHHTQSSGSRLASGTTTAAINRLLQPSRVTTSTKPRIAQETVIAAGTAQHGHGAYLQRRADKHSRKMRPPRKAARRRDDQRRVWTTVKHAVK